MYVETANVTRPDPEQQSPAALVDLEAMVAEVGATFPLMAYTVQADETDEHEAMNAAILAGLVAP
jgi:hypothetical protein